VTGGRLEVTALGDEVNEAARIQQSARDGALLASKSLLERLEPDDAAALDLDPDRFRYRTLAELEGATDKARRDAGNVAVAEIRP
jgi:class 3 adenylate cyclase